MVSKSKEAFAHASSREVLIEKKGGPFYTAAPKKRKIMFAFQPTNLLQAEQVRVFKEHYALNVATDGGVQLFAK